MPEFKAADGGVTFWLRVKPRAAHERLTLDSSGELRLEIHAPALEGQANEACTRFFTRALRLPQSAVAILSGHKARRKLIRVAAQSAPETIARIEAAIATLK
jgi:uncharacterized protein (TIGR00251 family)